MLANDQLSTAIELIACFTYHASAQAGVAQLVEQRIRNAKVGGSTPLSGTIFFSMTIKALYVTVYARRSQRVNTKNQTQMTNRAPLSP